MRVNLLYDINDLVRRADFEGYDVEVSNSNKLKIFKNHQKEMYPIIYGYYKEDDEDFWFSPEIVFPKKLSEYDVAGASFEYFVESWYNAAKNIADYMLDTKWYKYSELD